jgi:hypothetical protein
MTEDTPRLFSINFRAEHKVKFYENILQQLGMTNIRPLGTGYAGNGKVVTYSFYGNIAEKKLTWLMLSHTDVLSYRLYKYL